MQPFTPPKGINKEALIKLRKEQAAAKVAALQAVTGAPNATSTELSRKDSLINPKDAPDRLRIIFDNSSSMSGPKLEAAKEGVVEFLKNCTPNNTSIAIHLLNANYDKYFMETDYDNNSNSKSMSIPSNIKSSTLSSDLILIASEVVDDAVQAYGGTPLYARIKDALHAEPRATRLIAFSDGEPNGEAAKFDILAEALELKIPVDTVFISGSHEYASPSAIAEMKLIADRTGGIFLDLSKGNIKDGLKYLAPSKRLMLADASFKARVEKGEI